MASNGVLTSDENAPPDPPPLVRWLYKHGGELKAIRVDYKMLTEDSAQTIWHVEFFDGHKETVDESRTLAELLDFYPSIEVPAWRAIASMKKRLSEMCAARNKWEKAHAAELAEYRRLQAKFEGSQHVK